MALGLLVVITVAGIEADQQFTSAHDDATLIEIDASVATPDEILAANNYFVRERV